MSILIDLVNEDFGISGRGRWWRSDLHSSLVVDSEKDIFFFNVKGLSGGPVDYLTKVRGIDRKSAELMIKNHGVTGTPIDSKTSVQTRFEKLVELFYTHGKTDRKYWYSKGLTDETVDRYRLGFFDGWYFIPIYYGGKFVNFQCRRSEPKKAIKFWYEDRDFRQVLYNAEILKFVDTVYITEGMIDCIMLNQKGLPSVCSTNGSMSWDSSWIKYFTKIKNIFYIPDNDKAGVSGAIKTAKALGNSRVKIFRFKDKEEKYGALNFFLDGGTTEDFKELLNKEAVYGFEESLV